MTISGSLVSLTTLTTGVIFAFFPETWTSHWHSERFYRVYIGGLNIPLAQSYSVLKGNSYRPVYFASDTSVGLEQSVQLLRRIEMTSELTVKYALVAAKKYSLSTAPLVVHEKKCCFFYIFFTIFHQLLVLFGIYSLAI